MAGGILRCFAVFFLSLLLACSSTTGRSNQGNGLFPDQGILPIRELSLVLLVEHPDLISDAERLIHRASNELEIQVGIRLSITDTLPINLPGRSREKMLGQVRGIMKRYPYTYDLAVAFSQMTFLELTGYALFGGWEGVIDAAERRYIVIRRKSVEILMHEICHAFIFETTHSGEGLMTALSIQILPGLTLNRSARLSERDKNEILLNKYRVLGTPGSDGLSMTRDFGSFQ